MLKWTRVGTVTMANHEGQECSRYDKTWFFRKYSDSWEHFKLNFLKLFK